MRPLRIVRIVQHIVSGPHPLAVLPDHVERRSIEWLVVHHDRVALPRVVYVTIRCEVEVQFTLDWVVIVLPRHDDVRSRWIGQIPLTLFDCTWIADYDL